MTSLFMATFGTHCPALEFNMPGNLTYEHQETLGVHQIATGPAFAGTVPKTEHEGPMQRYVWEITEADSTRALLRNIWANAQEQGFEENFSCQTSTCGGFDFRFGIDVVQAPDMFVDLSDFQYLSAYRDDAVLSVLVSKSGALYYVQTTLLGGPEHIASNEPSIVLSTMSPSLNTFATELTSKGSAVLQGLNFAQGSAELNPEANSVLTDLAAYLTENPQTSIALVGHTDNEGDKEGNMSLSLARAQSVRDHLVETFSVPEDRIDAHGIGFFSPLTSNETDTGRAKNRRVEVVITSTQ